MRVDAASDIFASLEVYDLQSLSETAVIYGFASTATGQAAPAVTIRDNGAWSLFALN